MTRKLIFWILFLCVSAGVLALAIPNFTRSFAVISLDLRMDRAAALSAAKTLAAQRGLGPGGVLRQAAAFSGDDTVKTFVELEAGGAEAFRAMLRDHLYDAYTWQVRLFREGETREVMLRFRPDGKPYGFVDQLREDAPGANLSVETARIIAETTATRDWGLDLSHYTPLEPSTEHRSGGRADHTFLYERNDAKAGEGRYRVRLVVAGDRLIELTHFLRVPEAFSRTYEKMRSSNNAIAFGATAVMALLFIIGGCIIGLFVLMRRRELWWTPALVWGFVISGLGALAQFSALPLSWMEYDTAISGGTFLLRQVMVALLVFVADGCLMALTFAAAEGLGRRAFPQHPQLWRMWSRDAAGSRSVVGRTLGGTLLTGIEFGYIIGFYAIATKLWHWWTPAEALVDPNVLASTVPWLSAVAPSLHAGMWEESLFRAVPLAGAALIGNRLGNRKLWIGIGLIVEAMVFGGAHANYASWPAFSRPVELIVPSLIWGFVYLRYGLLPSIITHYLFDLSLFSLPLFTSTAAGAHIDQIAIILCGLAPLGIVAWGMLRQGGLSELPASLRNSAWIAPAEEAEPAVTRLELPTGSWSSARTGIVLALGALAIVAWGVFGMWHTDAPVLKQHRAEALDAGLKALATRGYTPDPKWKQLVTTNSDDEQSTFVWRALGANTYRKLIGRDLAPPYWDVRLANFKSQDAAATKATGARDSNATRNDVAERAEEWRAWITGDGVAYRVRHVLPDGRAGAQLDADAARALAAAELRERFQIESFTLREVSATPTQHPARRDWVFTYEDRSPPHLNRGERRIALEVSGDRVSDAYRYVFVPEDWQRQQRREEATLGVLGIVRALLVIIVIIAAAAFGIVAWSRRAFPVGFAVRFFVLALVFGSIGIINSWPRVVARFQTAQPLELQTIIGIIALTLGQLVMAGIFALVSGWALSELPRPGARRPSLAVGLACGAIASGLLTVMGHFSSASSPLLGDLISPQATLPWAESAAATATSLLTRAATLLAMLVMARRIGSGSTGRRILAVALLLVGGGIVAMNGSPTSIGSWLALAGLTGVAVVAIDQFLFSQDPRVIPMLLTGMATLAALRSIGRHTHPDVLIASVIEIAMITVIAYWWSRELSGGHSSRDAQ